MTESKPWRKARSVNQTSAAYVSKAPTLTEPSGDAGTATGASVLDVRQATGLGDNFAMISFFGTGSDNTTFNCRILLWDLLPGTSDQWIQVGACEVQVTLSAITGVTGGGVVAAERFADTISLVAGNTVSVEVVSFGDDANIAHIVVDLKGARKLELSFKVGTATDCNAILKTY